jgi:hypothetical protein
MARRAGDAAAATGHAGAVTAPPELITPHSNLLSTVFNYLLW